MAERNRFLKLVGHDDPRVVGAWAERSDAGAAVIAENRRAARQQPSLEPADPCWVLAARTYAEMHGSTLTPEKRQRVLRTADRLGVRPFDANLIITVVQDRVRRGEPLDAALPTLNLIGSGRENRDAAYPAAQRMLLLLCALTIAIGLAAMLIQWILAA